MDRKTLAHIGLLICGTLLGLAFAESIGRLVRLKSGQADLSAYAATLAQTANQVHQQTENAVNTVLRDQLPFCSPREIVLMRGLVYDSSEIKDIGRIHDGKFVCSSEMGVLADPVPIASPDVSFRNMMIYAWIPIMIGENAKGFIIQVKDVNMVLNPEAFQAFNQPNRSYAVYMYDSRTTTLVQAFGAQLPLSKQEVLAGRLVERSGVFYRPICSARTWSCVVAAESHKAILARTQPLHGMLLLAGASLGDTMILALILYYQKHRSQEQQLRRAIRNGSLTLVYQPIVDIDTLTIVGAEALARWTNEEGEAVSPEVFIALAEDKGFVTDITRAVLRTACEELKDLLTAETFRLTLNISAQDLAHPEFLPLLEHSLSAADIKPSCIGLELTERSTSNRKEAIDSIAHLRKAGHTVYIDDFGTGYSSLAYLHDLAVDVIKIDRAFTATVGTNAITESIIPQILHMAGQLHLAVVVEGIETGEQAAYFREAGKGTLGQGWFFSKPVPAERLRQLLQVSASMHTLEI